MPLEQQKRRNQSAPRETVPQTVVATNVTDALDHVERVPDASPRGVRGALGGGIGAGWGAIGGMKLRAHPVEEVWNVLKENGNLLRAHVSEQRVGKVGLCSGSWGRGPSC